MEYLIGVALLLVAGLFGSFMCFIHKAEQESKKFREEQQAWWDYMEEMYGWKQ